MQRGHTKLCRTQVDDLVVAMDETLRTEATALAQRLRRAGRSVDLVLESKRMKWIFKVNCISRHGVLRIYKSCAVLEQFYIDVQSSGQMPQIC